MHKFTIPSGCFCLGDFGPGGFVRIFHKRVDQDLRVKGVGGLK